MAANCTRQTAEMFGPAWGGIAVVDALALSPSDDPAIWSVRLTPMRQDVMLVGHLPHPQRLIGLLLCGDPVREPICFRHAGALCLQRFDSGCSVLWYFHPPLCCQD